MKEWILRYAERGSEDEEEDIGPEKALEVEDFDPVSCKDFTNPFLKNSRKHKI